MIVLLPLILRKLEDMEVGIKVVALVGEGEVVAQVKVIQVPR
jgi:hypothetical protein